MNNKMSIAEYKKQVKAKQGSPEQEIQKAIIDFWELSGAVVVKINNGGIRKPDGTYIPPRELGIADLIIGYKSLFIAIEVKSPHGRVSDNQKAFLERCRASRCIGVVAWSIDDAIECKKTVDNLLEEKK